MVAKKIDDNQSQVLDITRQLTKLMIEKDTIEMNKILDAHFTLTHVTGYTQSKAEWFSEIEGDSMKYYSFKEVETTIDIDGDKATFIGQNVLDARIWGTRNKWRLQQEMHFEKHNGKWMIMESIATTF